MQEITKSSRPIKVAPAVFVSALSLAFIAGWLMGLAPDYLSTLGKIILYWVSIPTCVVLMVLGTIEMISASDITGIPPSDVTGVPPSKDSVSYVLSPEDLRRWRSIKKGMDRHEVVAILGQPDGPPQIATYRREVYYSWGRGGVWFERNSGPVVEVDIPEYI
jgi:hypothetical protein